MGRMKKKREMGGRSGVRKTQKRKRKKMKNEIKRALLMVKRKRR